MLVPVNENTHAFIPTDIVNSTSFPDCCIQSLFQSQQLAKSPNCTEVLRLLAQDRYLGTQARLPVNMKEPDDEATGLHV